MSNRTLFEFNHDLAFRIAEDPEGFARAMTFYLNSGHPCSATGLKTFGVQRFGMRHHSDDFMIQWGATKVSPSTEPE